jgi:hypothetical protein
MATKALLHTQKFSLQIENVHRKKDKNKYRTETNKKK